VDCSHQPHPHASPWHRHLGQPAPEHKWCLDTDDRCAAQQDHTERKLDPWKLGREYPPDPLGLNESAPRLLQRAPPALAYSNTIFYEFTNAPRWTTDLEVGYRPDSHWHISIGANNIFNVRPSKVPAQNTLYGISRYYLSSLQMDFNGAYYYLQASASF